VDDSINAFPESRILLRSSEVMVPKVPPALPSPDVPPPGVNSAWRSLGGPAPSSIEVLREVGRTKPALYRLIFDGSVAVYAKRSPTSEMAVERAVYQEVLPDLPLTTPRCLGSCREDGSTWLFLEEVGDRRLNEHPDHPRLAARWLARLHGSAAAHPRARTLPDVGPPRYLARLRGGREGIRANLRNRALSESDRAVLSGMLEQLDALESRWSEIERACEGLPVTLVHGDFRPKNVRVAGPDADPTVYGLDWEMAGWGIPAADLASAFDRTMLIPVDAGAYLEAMRPWWGGLDDAAVRRLSILGRVFQALASTEWATASLIFESERHLMRPIAQMRLYLGHLTAAVREGRETLGWS